jgi:hypothetical protein
MGITLIISIIVFFPDSAFAQLGGGDFESRVSGLTNKLVTVLLPLASILGLVYAVIISLFGDGGGKAKVITVIAMSIVGFLAPVIIRWLQSATGN